MGQARATVPGMDYLLLLVGVVVQAVVIYGAIRVALIHDRAAQARERAKVKAAALWKARAEEARAAAEAARAASRGA
jgi:hypothetical protein